MPIRYMAAVLLVDDVTVAKAFYESLLGQEVIMDHGGVHVVFEGGFAIWQADRAYAVLFEGREPPSGPLGSDNAELYFEAENLDDAWKVMTNNGVTIVHSMIEQPWGQRCFRVKDPDGHIVEVGEPMWVVIRRFLGEGLDVRETAKRTSMPLDIIQEIAEGMG